MEKLKSKTWRPLLLLVLILVLAPNYPALCQIQYQHQIVTIYGRNSFGLGENSEELNTKAKLIKYSRAGLIDSFMVGNEKHYRMFVPVRVVWVNLPKHYDTAIIQTPGNILKQDAIMVDWTTGEGIIPDSLFIEEWEFSKKKVRKLPVIVKTGLNDFIYGHLSPGLSPAKSKQDLDKKAKKAKEDKIKLINKMKKKK